MTKTTLAGAAALGATVMYRDHFPRLFELRDLLPNPLPARTALPALDETLMLPGKREYFERIEADLQRLDASGWEALKGRMTRWPKTAPDPQRALEPLYDALNEVKAYNYLQDTGCSHVRFIPVSEVSGQKTPDLGADDHGREVLCEVKTINRSEVEVDRAQSGGVGTSTDQLTSALLEKIRKICSAAKDQMLRYDGSGSARKIAYVFVNFDDHEYSSAYLAQLEQFRTTDPVPGLEIVFDSHPPWGFLAHRE
jgi:hypothetical protein